jgi:hypothetical protein
MVIITIILTADKQDKTTKPRPSGSSLKLNAHRNLNFSELPDGRGSIIKTYGLSSKASFVGGNKC